VPIDSKIRVFRSPIHGYGVIAVRDFEPGEVVAEVEGVLYREHEIEDDKYCLWVDDDFYLDMVDQTRWINHSCDPNTEVEASWDAETKSLTAWWVATRDIEIGEELTYDYAFSAEVAEACYCGTAGCRGLIIDLDELERVPEQLQPLLRVVA
jgi:SET domain-containing protein